MSSVGEEGELLHTSVGNAKRYSYEQIPYDPVISLLDIYLREMKTHSYKKTSM